MPFENNYYCHPIIIYEHDYNLNVKLLWKISSRMQVKSFLRKKNIKTKLLLFTFSKTFLLVLSVLF